MSSIGVGEPFVDGGIVLLARPYSDREWVPVRKAWWWHTVGMFAFPFWCSMVALTIWQEPSRQPFVRRAFWALGLSVLSLTVVGIPLLVVFSRRWYWLWRMNVDIPSRGMPVDRRGPEFGALAQSARAGAALADRVTTAFLPQLPGAAHQLNPSTSRFGAPAMAPPTMPTERVAPAPLPQRTWPGGPQGWSRRRPRSSRPGSESG